jgi:PQQ-dependent dehydrogenase (methanol/ethanol family)
VYYGTANPGPWNQVQRPGANHFTAGLFARDARTGEAVWYYQMTPHDRYDFDGVNENVLIDLAVGGTTRKVLVHPDRNGYLYVIDRATGEVLSATAYAPLNSTTGVDLASGSLVYAPAKDPQPGKVVRNVCPAASGAKDWQPSAYSARTKYLYIPRQNLCQDIEHMQASYIAGTPYVGSEARMTPGPGGHRGELVAWDIAARQRAWTVIEDLPVWSGALATAGDIVFYGTLDGWFKAVDARDGKLLWRYKTTSGIIGQPVSYRGPDGKQYVAVLSGVGGWIAGTVVNDLDVRDKTANSGHANVLPDLKSRTQRGGTLYVFALP